MAIPQNVTNNDKLQFKSLEDEEYREYEFESGAKIRIDNPWALHVSANGHRVLDKAGLSHYIPLGWIHLTWKVREGQPYFAF